MVSGVESRSLQSMWVSPHGGKMAASASSITSLYQSTQSMKGKESFHTLWSRKKHFLDTSCRFPFTFHWPELACGCLFWEAIWGNECSAFPKANMGSRFYQQGRKERRITGVGNTLCACRCNICESVYHAGTHWSMEVTFMGELSIC